MSGFLWAILSCVPAQAAEDELTDTETLEPRSNPNLEANVNQALWALHAATSVYFGSAARWRSWWLTNKARYVDSDDGHAPAAPPYVDPAGRR